MLRVVLGEDSYLAREGISRALEAAEEIELVASGGTLDEVLQAVERLWPDVVLSDVRMPPNHTDEGIRLANELRRSHPESGCERRARLPGVCPRPCDSAAFEHPKDDVRL